MKNVDRSSSDQHADDDDLSQRDLAYHSLRRLLILQQVKEGERLRETEWAERLGVNRTALREAFVRLAAEGLIEEHATMGYSLPVFTKEVVQQIMEVRLLLESGAIDRLITERLNTPERLKGMLDSCDQLAGLISDHYSPEVADVDRRFHDSMVQAAGNERLAILYSRAPLFIIHPNIIEGRQWAETTQRTLEEHRAILTAILESDAKSTYRLLAAHLQDRR